ncbi:MAG: hypothetical protein AW09_001306 [Candidatus Accumulibacter phosphatis]|uniref:Uncharacterized protein n=1 Tax=Candidatus Accumulibacter phosphatis TaxID=327160 RepID=A0A080LXK8_9PROT|nr:MAG: hypothetical protein AW09_001306 [Candidatus Accumulibacter phosphatis]
MVGVNLGERGHHLLERRLVVDHLVGGRERVADTVLFKEELKLLGDDVPQRHLAGDLDAVDLELARDLPRCFGNLGVTDHGLVGRVLSHKGQHRHQVRLTGAVVADHQHAHVVDRLVEGKLRNHLLGDPLGHVVRHDIGRDELLRLVRTIGVQQLDDRFDRFELNEIAVAHVFLSSVLLNFEGNHASKAVVLVFRVPHFGVGQSARSRIALQLAGPNRDDAFRVRVTLQQIERIELERAVEQEFDVVQQQQVATGMLIGQLTQDRCGLQVTLSLPDCRQAVAQFHPDIQRCEPSPSC